MSTRNESTGVSRRRFLVGAAAAAGAIGVGGRAGWRSGGDAFWPAAGLLLVLVAGYMAEATYQHMLLLLGVAFLGGHHHLAPPGSSLSA